MKKGLVCIVCTFLLFSSCMISVSASGSGQLSVYGRTGRPGDTVSIAVNLNRNPGLITMKFSVSYDSDLELLNVSDSGRLKGWTTPSPEIKSPYIIRWADSLSKTNNVSTGRIVTLNFKIKNDALTGNKTVTIHFEESRDANGGKNEFSDVSATVTVTDKSYLFGDLNNDGKYTAADSMFIRLIVAEMDKPEQNINYTAADVNGDGKCTAADVMYIRRLVAELISPEELPVNMQ